MNDVSSVGQSAADKAGLNRRSRAFFIVLTAQFFSALGDNALVFAAIALLKAANAPEWQIPLLQEVFVFAYILPAPFVGAFADAQPKGRVMFISNGLKIIGCTAMLFGFSPLASYALVGLGAASYSPAKYGILVDLLPKDRLIWANGWMEGMTVASVILGAIIGGALVGPRLEAPLTDFLHTLPMNVGIDSPAELALAVILALYGVAAGFNLLIPRLPIERKADHPSPLTLIRDCASSFLTLWRDPIGQVSLAVTSLFWGTGTTLRFVVLAWAPVALQFDIEQSTQLTAVVAVGLAIGATIAANHVPLQRAVHIMPVGIAMGITVVMMAWVTDWRVALAMLILIGIFGGCFVVPMNALLQHRGHELMGAGHSIALQNLNENLSILIMMAAYSGMVKSGLPIGSIVVVVGAFIAVVMTWLSVKHWRDQA